MYKSSTTKVVTYFFLPIYFYVTYFLWNGLPWGNRILTQVRFMHNLVITGIIQWMVYWSDGFTLAHYLFEFCLWWYMAHMNTHAKDWLEYLMPCYDVWDITWVAPIHHDWKLWCHVMEFEIALGSHPFATYGWPLREPFGRIGKRGAHFHHQFHIYYTWRL
jgi:hypothetical protein